VIGFERAGGLGVEKFAFRREHEQIGKPVGLGKFAQEGLVLIFAAPVDVDDDEVRFQSGFQIGVLMQCAIEQMAPGALACASAAARSLAGSRVGSKMLSAAKIACVDNRMATAAKRVLKWFRT
jgi:hypothetical protein